MRVTSDNGNTQPGLVFAWDEDTRWRTSATIKYIKSICRIYIYGSIWDISNESWNGKYIAREWTARAERNERETGRERRWMGEGAENGERDSTERDVQRDTEIHGERLRGGERRENGERERQTMREKREGREKFSYTNMLSRDTKMFFQDGCRTHGVLAYLDLTPKSHNRITSTLIIPTKKSQLNICPGGIKDFDKNGML